MKRCLLPLFLFLLSAAKLHAIIITPFITQTQYRWRNDDGNETAATWKAPVNTAITVSDTTSVLRVRIELNNNSGGGNYNINESLEYSSNGGTSWTTMTNAPTNAFRYVSSTFVADGAATTNQMGTVTAATFVPGRIIAALPSATAMSLGANKTEFEWVIKPTANILPLTTYTFRSAAQGSTPVVYPTLNTTCVGVYVVSKRDSFRCGAGIVQLKATGSGTTVLNWFDAPSGGASLGTGAVFNTPPLTASKTYYVSASSGTCESPRTAVTATINPLPMPSLGDDISVCENNAATFNAGTFAAYLWDNGSTQQTRTVNTPGTYFVTVTGSGGCKGGDTVKLLNYPRPVVNLGNDTFICPGVTLTLDAGNPGMTYLWDNASAAQTRSVSGSGDFSVVVTNEFGCPGTDQIKVTVKDLPLGTLGATHGAVATYTFKVLNPQFAVGYTWDFGDGSPVEAGELVDHTYSANGIYLVRLLLEGDCGSNAERERTVDVFDAGGATGIGRLAAGNDFQLYPNPAKEMLVVETRKGIVLKSLEVYTIMGQKVKAMNAEGVSRQLVTTGDLAAGVYSLKINTDKGTVVRKFEVSK